MYKDIINNRFPEIKLFYGNHLHSKVDGDLFQIRPRGKKCLIWYTYIKGDNICFLLTLDSKLSIIEKIEKQITSFNSELCLGKGTILSGIYLKKNLNFFSITDIHYYKGQNINYLKFSEKLNFLYNLLHFETNQNILVKDQLSICLCLLTKSYQSAIEKSISLDYNISEIGIIDFKANFIKGYMEYKNCNVISGIFKVKANLTFDIYNLYLDKDEFHGHALISDYKTSVRMNKYFRIIKENDNLDLLEESDSESEFENTNIDKFVNLDKSLVMRCVLNTRFNKWQPLDIITGDSSLSTRANILSLEKKSKHNIYNERFRTMGKSKRYGRKF